MLYDVVIVGGASAGLTAAIYASRQGLKTLVVTKDIGGQALLTSEIQNYPGFSSIGGFELTSRFEEQARASGAEFVYDEVVRIEGKTGCPEVCFLVHTSSQSFETVSVILAFGKTPRDLGVPGESEFKGKGVSYCAVCDGPLFRDKVVVVAGSADPALDAASLLSGVASRVYVVHTWDKPIGDEDLIRTLEAKENVEFVPNSQVVRVQGEEHVDSVVVEDVAAHEKRELVVAGLFIELGYVAKTEFVKDLVVLNGRREIVVDKNMETSQRGVFAAGDVTDTGFKQAVISAGQGAIAALSAYNYVQKLRGRGGVRADWKVKPLTKG